ncbi:MAG: BON domain-containing protein [Methylococcales bacterium]|jgi:osmotically-inducible protein OsmY
MKKLFLLFLLLNTLLIVACSSVATNPDSLVEQTPKPDRRSHEAISIDKVIETEATAELNSDDEIASQSHVTINTYNGATLISGETANEALKNKIVSIVQVIPNITLIHDNLIIAPPSDANSRANDQLITDTIKTSLVQIKSLPDFDPAMIKVVTENGTVFLMGIVRRAEGAIVIKITRLQPGVKQIITLFEYAD